MTWSSYPVFLWIFETKLFHFTGKTESTKILVQHIVTLCRAEHEGLHDKIVQVSYRPIHTEATFRNNFGSKTNCISVHPASSGNTIDSLYMARHT